MIFAQITNNIIVNTIMLDDISLLPLFQNDPNGNPYDLILQIDNITPQPGVGWTFNSINYNAPPAAPVTLTTIEIYTSLVQAAIDFGNALILQFTTQNVMAGITRSGKTLALLNYCSNLYIYLSTGSLYVAISEIQTMIADTSDTKAALVPFITNDVLYVYLNELQGYLNIPLTPNPGD